MANFRGYRAGDILLCPESSSLSTPFCRFLKDEMSPLKPPATEKFSLWKRPAWAFLTLHKKKSLMFKLELHWKKTQIWMNSTELLAMTDSSQGIPGASQTQVKAQSQSWGLYGLNSEVTAREVDSDSTKENCHRILQEPGDIVCSCHCSRALCWSSPNRERSASSSPTYF